MNSFSFIFCAVIILSLCNLINAQINISGFVKDNEQTPISDVLIELFNRDDSLNIYTTTTNDQGSFNIDVITNIQQQTNILPDNFMMIRNYPNPFNPSTIIHYQIPYSEIVEIKIYDILGREVYTVYSGYHKAGTYEVIWNGRNHFGETVSAGIYFCRLKSTNYQRVHKMVLLDGGSSSTFSKQTEGNIYRKTNTNNLEYTLNFRLKLSGLSIIPMNIENLHCSGDTTLEIVASKILTTLSIGPEGGKIEFDDLTLTIPANAFAALENIMLSTSFEKDPFENERISNEYIINDFPLELNGPLKLQLKHNGNLSGETYIVLGEDGMSPEYGDTELIYDFIPVLDSAGYLSCLIAPDTIFSTDLLNKSNSDKKRILIKAVSKYYTYLNSIEVEDTNYEYKIYLPEEINTSIPKIVELFDNVFYECMLYLRLFPLSPCPSIYVANLNENIFCKFAYRNPKGNKKAKGIFALNINHLNNFSTYGVEDKMRISIGKEFLRFVLFNYDPTFPIMDDPNNENHYWLKQALVTWFDHHMDGEYEYVPPDFIGNEYSPLNGMHAGINYGKNDAFTNARNHGSGMSTLSEFLQKSPIWLGSVYFYPFIFSQIKEGKHPVEAFNKYYSFMEPPSGQQGLTLMWFEYLSTYIHNRVNDEIFYVQPETFINSISPNDTFAIKSSSDSLITFKRKYKDLSAKLFKITIEDNYINENGSLIFDINNSSNDLKNIRLDVFGLGHPYLELLESTSYNEDATKLMITNLNEYNPILVLVINGKYSPPYTNDSEIQFDVRIDTSPFHYCDISLSVVAIDDTTEGSWSPGWYTDGYFIDNIYYGKINSEKQGGNAEGKIEIKVDKEFNIIELNVLAHHSDEFGSSEWGFSAANIPPTENEAYLKVYNYLGYDVCKYVKAIHGYYSYTNGTVTKLDGFKCESESHLHIKFHNWR